MKRTALRRTEWTKRKVPLPDGTKRRDGPARRGKNLVCVECGTEFYATPLELKRGVRYCSNACNGAGMRVLEDRRCTICRSTFSVKPSSTRKTCGRACANEAIRRSKQGSSNPNYRGDDAALIQWRSQATDACVVCGSSDRLHLHHVVYDQHVRSQGGNRWDPADSLTLCIGCHCRHHANPNWALPRTYLRDENYEFAFELMGPAAYDYLRRRYSGDDERLDAALENDLARRVA